VPIVDEGDSMKPAVLGLMLAAVQVLSGSATSEQKPTLQLDLSPVKIEVESGTDFHLSMRVVNLTHRIVDCTRVVDSNNMDVTYTYDVRTSDGKALSKTDAPGALNARPCTLGGPNHSFETTVGHLMDVYQMNRPGVYTVQVSRPDQAHPGQFLGKSNIVSVTVKAPE
jgi:hypothetical protein